MNIISRTVWILSIVSLLTDVASEMLYPIMPLYLKNIGFSVILIGTLEGFAEAIAGLSKGYFGKLSDLKGKRVPFVQFGYLLSAISKPIMGILPYPTWVFLSRTLDRFGKGLRTGARDALLSDEANQETKGTVFGFHRAMDTFGAVLGPTFALVYLHFYPENYAFLFLFAGIPGLLAFFVSGFLKEKTKPVRNVEGNVSILSYFTYWKDAPSKYKRLITGLLIFGIANSSDLFLLLLLKTKGAQDSFVIGIYIFYNLVYALFSFPIGLMADRVGLIRTLLIGLFLFCSVYAGMAFAENSIQFYLLFFLYGLYAAATEGVAKALISNIVPESDTATAIGTFAGLGSISALFASYLGGIIWFYMGAQSMFFFSAILTFGVIVYFARYGNALSLQKS
ncbi:MFS transporter [Leptospira langatensis]|uniref:MFS transporter n=1 Tax=Leptospira langatensis TaxID=2484983 RepID=A0A5F1ZRS7_9LEPT|nr:MFS transporter [Leptospira langatensis]TGJ98949.1 MFS transporter [Leptospira langatensis]TGL40482.1 MFS transporter [Leptospira langatensis]